MFKIDFVSESTNLKTFKNFKNKFFVILQE
jgi:hypothetical protein